MPAVTFPLNIIIRADASSEIGIGHVMRCLALGDAWQRQAGVVAFALATGARELADKIGSRGMNICQIDAVPGSTADALRTLELSEEHNAEWLIVDGYHFPADYFRILRQSRSRLLFVTDDGLMPGCDFDLVVDQSVDFQSTPRAIGELVNVLRGPEFALLRREFLEFAQRPIHFPEKASRILITFGGGDARNATLAVLEALNELVEFNLDVRVVIGPANPHRTTLEVAVKNSRHNVKLLDNVTKMAACMAEADLAITGGGGTCYELALMQVPMVLITIAENQEQTARVLAAAHAVVSAGPLHLLNPSQLSSMLADVIRDREVRRSLSERAHRIIDGKGAERIVQAMLALPGRTREMEFRK